VESPICGKRTNALKQNKKMTAKIAHNTKVIAIIISAPSVIFAFYRMLALGLFDNATFAHLLVGGLVAAIGAIVTGDDK